MAPVNMAIMPKWWNREGGEAYSHLVGGTFVKGESNLSSKSAS